MAVFLSIVTLAVFAIPASIAIAHWQKGELANLWHALYWGVFAYFVFGVGAGVTYYHAVIRPAKASDRLARAAKQVQPSSERPRVYVERAMARPLVAGQPKSVILWLKNGGSEPARRIITWVDYGVFDADFAGPLEFAPHDQPEARPDCQPGATISLAATTRRPTSQAEITALNSRKRLWFHFGKGTYEDESGSNTYAFDFCYMYDPAFTSHMAICHDRYWPKERASTSTQPLPSTRDLQQKQPTKSEQPTAEELAGPPRMGAGSGARPGGYPPLPYSDIKWTQYTEDYFGGLIWRWQYKPEMGDQTPRNIRCFCPDDDSMLRGLRGPAISDAALRQIRFACPDHPNNAVEVSCGVYDDYEGIRTFIQARLQNETWREVVIQQRKARSGQT